MPVIEFEEVTMVDLSDDALEAMKAVAGAAVFSSSCYPYNISC
jgi:hypothetical protein